MSENKLTALLKEVFEKRNSANPAYSLRSFARDLQISSGRLTNFLKERDIPGPKLVQRIALRLGLSEELTLELRQSVDNLRNTRKAEEVTRQWGTSLKASTGSLHMVDVKNLPEAREMIAKFQTELTAKLVDGNPSELYKLDIQLYPVKKNEAV